jgi:outer membrane protein assembly factor BamB
MVQAIGVRVLFYGGALVLALFYFIDMRTLLGLRPAGAGADTRPASAAESPGDWPNLRGPDYSGVSRESDLADSWPPEGPPVLWTEEIGRGYSALAVAGNRVYTLCQTIAEQYVVAMDADTGHRIWEHRCGWPFDPAGMYPGPRATPTWREGRVYIATPDGLVECLDDATGRALWSVNVNGKFGGRGTDFGYACSPLVEQGMVILPVGGLGATVVALDARTGETVWASGDEPASYCTALPITFRGRRQVVAFLQNMLGGFDLQTGRLLWHVSYSAGYDEHAAMPLYLEPRLLAAGPFRAGADLYELREKTPDGRPPTPRDPPGAPIEVHADLVAHIPQMSNDVASSVLVDGHVYGFDLRDVQAKAQRPSRGEFRCLDWKTGKVCWSTDRTGHVSLLAADGKLFLFSDRGEAILARATHERYEELGRVPVFGGAICWTPPALHAGRLYLRSPTRAACLYVGKPERLEGRMRERTRPASAIVDARPLDWTWVVGGEREYPADLLSLNELALWYGVSLGFLVLAAVAFPGSWILGRLVSGPNTACRAGVPPAPNAAETAAPQEVLPAPLKPGSAGAAPARSRGLGGKSRLAMPLFLSLAFLLGGLASPVVNKSCGCFALAWPVSLFVAHQATLVALLWAAPRRTSRVAPWVSLFAVLAFLGVCLLYFDLCRRAGLAPAWVFLFGFLPAWPVAIPAARRMLRGGPAWIQWVWIVVSFSLFFWAAAGVNFCRYHGP